MRLLICILALSFASFGQTQTAHTIQGSGTGTTFTTTSISTTGANFLVVAVTSIQGVTVTLTDSHSNPWTALTAHSVSGDTQTRLYYVNGAPVVGSTHTFTATCSGGNCYPTIGAQAWSGMLGTSGVFDQQNGASGSNVSSLATGSITPTQNGELLITAFGGGDSGDAVNSGFTLNDNFVGVGGHNYSEGMASQVQGTAAAINPTWTSTTTNNEAAAIASFKAGAATASTMPPAIR